MSILFFFKRYYRELKLLLGLSYRNRRTLDSSAIRKGQVKLEWVDNGNLGDVLGTVIFEWMLEKKAISKDKLGKESVHLYTCGSLIGVEKFDAVIWGSGVHVVRNVETLLFMKGIMRYDVRAVRGPLTRRILLDCGYQCPEVYGDPAIIMPLIYDTEIMEKKYDVSVILHYYLKPEEFSKYVDHFINIRTTDYKFFIKEIKASKKIISSSLHGIILAETYGVPAVFLNTGGYVDKALIKYYDWYYSTNRWNVKMARTIEEAIEMEPMPLPELDEMRRKLMENFPYDLWE